MKKPTEVDKDHHADFLCSVQLDPGTHTIDFILGPAGDGFLVNGRFDLEPDLRFELPAQGVTYLGRLNLLSRERKEGERRSGPLLPLIDQSVTGYANSHTDITVEDRADADIPRALELHPVLQGVTISKSLITIPAPKP
ncbi:MAG: hypothetical protein JNL97_08360 [Verrucomicrobiales bacterium]|nr:hypothetical protein [Verrucomicrobiales bacterium]